MHFVEKNFKQRLLARLSTLTFGMKLLFVFALFAFFFLTFEIGTRIIDRFLVEVPRHGGEFTEGIIGRPRFINPILARSDTDRDMTKLVYAGLLSPTPDGTLIPELARDYTVSEDGLTYTFTLKENLVWHDGVPLTTEDIIFTIDKIRNPGLAIKSPHRASWEGVELNVIDPQTIVFQLKQPYAAFLDSTTIGIIPKHIWDNVPDAEFDVSYYNIEPIGSGPYRVTKISRDNDKGLPDFYDLTAFKKYALGEPYITNMRIQFFGNYQELAQAYTEQRISQMHTINPEEARSLESKGVQITKTILPRVFALYFNQNQQPIFANNAVRKALDESIDKQRIIDHVLFGYGKIAHGPIPNLNSSSSVAMATSANRIERAKEILENDGWVLNAANVYEKTDKKKKTVSLLEFSVVLPDVPELRSAMELIKEDWTALGAVVSIKTFEQSNLTAEILAPRKYDMLFFGQITGRVPDPYAYWHSSQRNAPGLNVALYTNTEADRLVTEIRREHDETKRMTLIEEFSEIITSETPAIFLYSPEFLYVTNPIIKNIHPGFITTESERFLLINKWYIESERIWGWLAKRINNNSIAI